MPKPTHGGKRIGAGRKPAPGEYPPFNKKFRANDAERSELFSLLTGDSRRDFLIVLNALRKYVAGMNLRKEKNDR
jgi:hypothetical protein